MEVLMRTRSALAIGICALALGWSAAANAEYFNRYTDGSWTNAQYSDGTCTYYYSLNSQTGETHVNRYGNCSQVAIAPDGRPMPVMPTARVIVRPETVGEPVH
jgi:hypothetical protein